ncbi:hypothetical protein PFISCL1PPCAC_8836, partial [Pristionchus fissidentatus]
TQYRFFNHGMINTQSESLHWMRHRIGAILAEPVSITVSKKSLFLFLIGSVSLWILFTVIRGHDRTAGGYGSYLSSSLDFDESRECGIVPLPERIKDLKRIVISVRTEIADSSAKLDEVIKQYEEISHKIPEKQNQLAQVLAEIENARSLLRDLNDRRNVRVSLPSRPLLPLKTIVYSREEMSGAMEDSIDFSRCSLTTPLRIFLYPTSRSHPLYEVITNSPYYEPNPSSACLFAVIVSEHSNDSLKDLPYWSERGANHVILNTRESPMGRNETAHAIVAQAQFYPGSFRRRFDFLLPLSSSMRRGNSSDWEKMPTLLPYQRKYLLSLVVRDRWSTFDRDVERMQKSMKESEDEMRIIDCGKEKKDCGGMKDSLAHSHFTVLTSSSNRLIFDLLSALRVGSIPVVMRMDVVVPFEDFIDWSPVLLRFPAARLHELHFLLRDVPMADGLEMRRRGRRVLEEYLDSVEGVWTSLAAALSQRLSLPPIGHNPVKAPPLFNRTSFVAPIQTPVNLPVYSDDEYLGPLEAPFESPQFLHNVTSMSMYSYTRWNSHFSLGGTPEYSIDAVEMPNGAEFEEDTSSGFRPIEPGSGKEFSLALGGNRQREQFTIVMLTYNRDAILAASLEGLHKLPYLNKVIVIWNNIEREPQGAWPRLHVPVEFIRGEMNSLNNRFIPWDRIQTEAVLSLDDDIDLKQHEIVFAFRVWREQRRKIVGFPARQHSRFGSDLFYNSNHTCQMSMILTGAAFIHKSYLYSYTFDMPAAIREHVDKVTNCEDIAMNFLIAHLTREPPMKTTSKWTLRCPTCTDSLWSDGDHFNERHECIRLFTRIYGYNPLRYSQYRADSILFKTRIPTDMQKCFRYV